MAINSTLHTDEDGDACQRTMVPNKYNSSESRESRLFQGGTKANFVEISDLLYEGHVRFGYDDGKLVQGERKKLELESDWILPQVVTMTSREEVMKERAKAVEHRVQDLFDEVTNAEGLTIELQKNTVKSCPQISPRSLYASNVQVMYPRQENCELQEAVEDFQSLCASHETSTYSDNFDDHPLPEYSESNTSSSDNETKLLCWRNDQCAECIDRVEEVQELQEEVKLLSTKLKFSTTQRDAMKDVIVSSAAKLTEVMAANRTLKKELYVERQLVQAREKDVLNLETRVEALSTSNQMLKSIISLKKTAQDSRRSLNFSLLEPKLLDLAAIASIQNACVVRLSAQNESLARSLQSKIQESDHQHAQVSAAIKQKDAAIRALEQFKQQMVEWATEIDERALNYDLLEEYALNLEGDLRHSQSQHSALLQSFEELRKEHDQLSALQADALSRISDMENVLEERNKEVESISREALHLSLEVELLRRKLQQLEEDVLFKEGQISILRAGLRDNWEAG
ncbi:hypothetical protein KC19_12G094000 [Ceratodon purpureus]|uniref:Uncharacterized protein n=1 Tax=Ceratodon purpureus TaxID=3225 RepID=A0A8T0G6I9_CERPU|nr:hypothetical protein KC19_12G094000 [Ceratodon purpureus]